MQAERILAIEGMNRRNAHQGAQRRTSAIIEYPSAVRFEVRGTETLYKVVALREYDETDTLVAVGSESSPLDTGHSLQPTWDWVRAHA
jgi:hypothetical protein